MACTWALHLCHAVTVEVTVKGSAVKGFAVKGSGTLSVEWAVVSAVGQVAASVIGGGISCWMGCMWCMAEIDMFALAVAAAEPALAAGSVLAV